MAIGHGTSGISKRGGERQLMLDIVFIAATALFFGWNFTFADANDW
jgi:hypothetical protein